MAPSLKFGKIPVGVGTFTEGEENRSREDFVIGDVVQIEAIDVQGIAVFDLLRSPTGSTSELVSITPTLSELLIDVTGRWRCRISDTADGSRVIRTFAAPTAKRGLIPPAHNERSSADANDVDQDPGTWVDESESNEGGKHTGYADDIDKLFAEVESDADAVKLDVAAEFNSVSTVTASAGDKVLVELASDGTKHAVDAAEFLSDDQTAAEVPFTPDGDIAATDTQAAIVEVRDDTDTKLAGKALTAHNHDAADLTTGTLADGRVAQSNVTQHQDAVDHNALLNFDIAEHREINDAGTSTTELWSADKIDSEVATLLAGNIRKPGVDTSTHGLGNITLSGEQTLNGLPTSTSIVLVTEQTLPAENGFYVTAAGAWARASFADEDAEVSNGNLTDVLNIGSTKFRYKYMLVTPDPIVVGTTAQTWEEHRNIELGTTSGTAAEGNDSRIPTQDENDAQVGTSGTASSANRYVTDSDPRNTNDRTPTAHFHNASDINAGTLADGRVGQSSVTQHQGAINHNALLNFAADEHRSIAAFAGQAGLVAVVNPAETELEYQSVGGGGSVSFEWDWLTDVADNDPGTGNVKGDDVDQVNITRLNISDSTKNGKDIHVVLGSLQANDILILTEEPDSSRWIIFQLSGPSVEKTGYWELPGAVNQNGNALRNGRTQAVQVISLIAGVALRVATETFAATNARFFGELGLPASQGWVDSAPGSTTIDLVNETVFGIIKQVVRHNDDFTNGATTSSLALTAQNGIDIDAFGAFFSATSRLDTASGGSGFFAGLQFDAADNPIIGLNQRYGILFDNAGGFLRVTEPDAGGTSVVFDGMGGNPKIKFDVFVSWACVVPAGFGAAEFYVNGTLTTFAPTFLVNGGGLGTSVRVSSGSTGGTNRIVLHSDFGVTIYEESSTKTLAAATMAADVAQVIIPEGRRDYTVILPDGNPRPVGAKLEVVTNNVGGRLILTTQDAGAPESLFNGLRKLILDVAFNEIVAGVNTLTNSNVYLGFRVTSHEIFAQLSSSVDQIPGDTNPTPITFNTQDDIHGDGILHSTTASPEVIEFAKRGTYFLIPQPQVGKDSGGTKIDFNMFLQADRGAGFADEPNSNIQLTIKDSDVTDVIVSGTTIQMNAGDKIRIMQKVSAVGSGIGIKALAAVVGPPTVPATPSIILAIFRLGAL